MTKASDNEYPSILLAEQGAAPTTPAAGFWRAYAKSDGLYVVDDAGTETGPFGTGGGAGDWFNLALNNTGNSLTGWTARDGTWASNGTIIQQTNAAASDFNVQYDTLLPLAGFIAQCEVRLPSSNTTDDYIGMDLGINSASTTNTGLRVYLKKSGTSLIVATFQSGAETGAPTVTVNYDTWYTLRAVVFGSRISAYLDGTLMYTAAITHATVSVHDARYFGLFTALAVGDFRNIKVWVPNLPV